MPYTRRFSSSDPLAAEGSELEGTGKDRELTSKLVHL